jgi:hypothetical protein
MSGVNETPIHKAIVQWIEAVSPSTFFWHTPNSAKRSHAYNNALKAMGMRAGVPDLTIIAEPPGPCLAFLEVKTAKGPLSPGQKEFRLEVEGRGVPYAVVRSVDDVRAAFRAWLVPMREARP